MDPFACISTQTLYHETPVHCFETLKDNLYSGSDTKLALWNLKTSQLVTEVETPPIKRIDVNGKEVYAFTGDQLLVYFDTLAPKAQSPKIPNVVNAGLLPHVSLYYVLTSDNKITTYKAEDFSKKAEFTIQLKAEEKKEEKKEGEKPEEKEGEKTMKEEPAQNFKITFIEPAKFSGHIFYGIGHSLFIVNVTEDKLELGREYKSDRPVIGGMDVDQQSMAFLETTRWCAFQKDCEAPYYESEPNFTFEPDKIYGFNGKHFYIVTKNNEVNIWNFYTQHDMKMVPAIKDLVQFRLISLSQLAIAYGGEDPRIELKEMVIHEEHKLTLDADYFRGAILNYRKENRVEELMDDMYFRGFYENNERHGPAILIRKNQRITCNYTDGWMVGPIEIIELNENRLKIVGIADYYVDNYSDIKIQYFEVNGLKFESTSEEHPITGTNFSGPARLTFKDGTVITVILENNRLKPDQQGPNNTIKTTQDTEPVKIRSVIQDNKIIDDQNREFDIDFAAGTIKASEVEI